MASITCGTKPIDININDTCSSSVKTLNIDDWIERACNNKYMRRHILNYGPPRVDIYLKFKDYESANPFSDLDSNS